MTGVRISETEFERKVVDLAHAFGWKVAGFRPARSKRGWVTPVKYDGKGWPDLTLVHASRGAVIFAELKSMSGSLEPEQKDWGDVLSAATAGGSTAVYRVWKPSDAPEICEALSFGRVSSWTW